MPSGTYFEGCDSQGYVLLTEKLGDLQIPGQESPVPIWAFFSSEYTTASPYAGMWRIGILDMSLVQIGENQFRMLDPGGNETMLSRNAKDKTILEGPGWKGTISNDRIKMWASCGWNIEFVRGRVSRMTTQHNKVITYNYVDGCVSSITCDGKPLMTLGNLRGSTLDITINDKKLSIVRAEQPRVQHTGNVNKVVERGRSLSSITGQGESGYGRTYTYTVDEETRPVIVVADKYNQPFKIVWDPQTRKILRYQDWEYMTTRDRKTDWDTIELKRRDSKGEVESYYNNIGTGTRITQRGTSKRSEYEFTSGPAVGKLRKIEDMLDGKVTNLQQYFYDEKGRIIRGKENEDTLKFEYDDKKYTATAWKNNALLWKKHMDAKGRILKVDFPDGKELRLKYREDRAVEAELVSGSTSVSVQLNDDGWIKDGTEIFRRIMNR